MVLSPTLGGGQTPAGLHLSISTSSPSPAQAAPSRGSCKGAALEETCSFQGCDRWLQSYRGWALVASAQKGLGGLGREWPRFCWGDPCVSRAAAEGSAESIAGSAMRCVRGPSHWRSEHIVGLAILSASSPPTAIL